MSVLSLNAVLCLCVCVCVGVCVRVCVYLLKNIWQVNNWHEGRFGRLKELHSLSVNHGDLWLKFSVFFFFISIGCSCPNPWLEGPALVSCVSLSQD